jgi:hypothetical protein
MGASYADQFFFDLETKTVVSSNTRQAWDLAFESTQTGYHVFLNSSKFMFAYNSGKQTLAQVSSYSQSKKKYDEPSGNADSTAIGEWGTANNGVVETYNYVYLVDRGADANAQPLEKRKLIINGLHNNIYSVTFANLDGSDEHTVDLTKNTDYNRVYLTFDNGGSQVTIEPAKSAWDLEFSMYTHIFDEAPVNIPFPADTLPYLVNGVLQNPGGVLVAKDTVLDFDSITVEDSNVQQYSASLNTIGYDWKTFQFNDEDYTIEPHRNYFVKTPEGHIYKLRFIDFYNSQGVKGYPTFQFQELR